MKGFYHIWAWRPSWSRDLDPANKLSSPHPTEVSYKNLASIGQAVLEKKSFEMVDGRRTDDGACLYYKLTNEPKGSGELEKIYIYLSVFS